MESSKFSFNDYDCIGFDLDSTLARYRLGNLMPLVHDTICNYLIAKGYPGDFFLQPIDTNFLVRGLIIDDENGNIVRVGADGTILQATHGTKWLSKEEMLKYYPTGHKNAINSFAEDPLPTYGTYSGKLKILIDYFDVVISLIFARAVDTVEVLTTTKKICDIWPDIVEATEHMYSRENFLQDMGGFYPAVKTNPDRYYYKSSPNVLNWLKSLKKNGKHVFLLTGSHIEHASHTARVVLGDGWRDYFDIVITGAGKPGFFIKDVEFTAEMGPIAPKDLKPGEIYAGGNFNGLKEFFYNLTKNAEPKILYVGDNLIQDTYAPNQHCACDTVSVCEELEAENAFGFTEQPHPDQNFLCSTLWGSYFNFVDNIESFWFSVIKKHCKISVPSIEYVAKYPVDHKFDLLTSVITKSNSKSTENKAE